MKGQKAVKLAKTLYLPMLGGRSVDAQERYEKYLKRALFFNATRRTLEALTGFLFRKPPIFTPDDSELLDTLTNNPGGFQAFVQEMATELLEVGRFVILVDAPVDGGDPGLYLRQPLPVRHGRGDPCGQQRQADDYGNLPPSAESDESTHA